MPILPSEALLRENQKKWKMLPPGGIEPGPVINRWFQVQHSLFWANLACAT